MLGRVRTSWQTWRTGATRNEGASLAGSAPRGGERRRHNLFEAAAVYVAARAEGDQERAEEAAAWVDPGALAFGVDELARRAVIALARERDASPREVARSLLGLPAA
ncbi:hypothetical protein [Streptomyces xanthii]|uniref:Uncharacterized protein n=1 Tax=Streptomyces xanthii TaxID=2768069 RepID=A0A7H1BFT6_9ACTN|nr:hypothetical protein [Streptomyces xanthii]QNS07591.1 hypothetical protein IAG42_30950 [Streptomyces xanthii]